MSCGNLSGAAAIHMTRFEMGRSSLAQDTPLWMFKGAPIANQKVKVAGCPTSQSPSWFHLIPWQGLARLYLQAGQARSVISGSPLPLATSG